MWTKMRPPKRRHNTEIRERTTSCQVRIKAIAPNPFVLARQIFLVTES